MLVESAQHALTLEARQVQVENLDHHSHCSLLQQELTTETRMVDRSTNHQAPKVGVAACHCLVVEAAAGACPDCRKGWSNCDHMPVVENKVAPARNTTAPARNRVAVAPERNRMAVAPGHPASAQRPSQTCCHHPNRHHRPRIGTAGHYCSTMAAGHCHRHSCWIQNSHCSHPSCHKFHSA